MHRASSHALRPGWLLVAAVELRSAPPPPVGRGRVTRSPERVTRPAEPSDRRKRAGHPLIERHRGPKRAGHPRYARCRGRKGRVVAGVGGSLDPEPSASLQGNDERRDGEGGERRDEAKVLDGDGVEGREVFGAGGAVDLDGGADGGEGGEVEGEAFAGHGVAVAHDDGDGSVI